MKKNLLLMSLMIGTSNLAIAVTPEQILADGIDSAKANGIVSRKGSIGAFINNVMYLNEHLKQPGPNQTALKTIKDMRDSIPVQHSLDLFKVFSINDWFEKEDKAGTIMAGVLYLQQFPEHCTPELMTRIAQLAKNAHPLLKNEIKKLTRDHFKTLSHLSPCGRGPKRSEGVRGINKPYDFTFCNKRISPSPPSPVLRTTSPTRGEVRK